jgi:hypothetical protein
LDFIPFIHTISEGQKIFRLIRGIREIKIWEGREIKYCRIGYPMGSRKLGGRGKEGRGVANKEKRKKQQNRRFMQSKLFLFVSFSYLILYGWITISNHWLLALVDTLH